MAKSYNNMTIEELENARDGIQQQIEALRARFKEAGLALEQKRRIEGVNKEEVEAQIAELQSLLVEVENG